VSQQGILDLNHIAASANECDPVFDRDVFATCPVSRVSSACARYGAPQLFLAGNRPAKVRGCDESILDIRIVSWYFKLAYVVGASLVGFPVFALFNILRLPLVGNLASTAVTLAGIVLGARVFRGRDEPVTPRRPWWQMTARPLLSRVLGIIFLMTVISTLIEYVLAAQGDA
jgi:hypothetical protein